MDDMHTADMCKNPKCQFLVKMVIWSDDTINMPSEGMRSRMLTVKSNGFLGIIEPP